jgi:glycerophosphoryl diester phosphodiesterase
MNWNSLLLNFLFLIIPVLSYGQTMDVQGHRGNRGLRPENTLPAFATAIEAGADTLELDLLVSKDGELIIYHDYLVNEHLCTYLDGSPISHPRLIHSLTLSEIKQLDCGRKKNSEFPKQSLIRGTQIPTLGELLELIRNLPHPNAKKIRLNLEIKRDPNHPEFTLNPPELVKKVIDKVKQSKFSDRVYYSSFDPEVLSEVRKVDPNAQIGFLFDEESLDEARKIDPQAGIEFLVHLASSLKADVLSPEHSFLKDANYVRSLQKSGFRVIPWTVNHHKRWAELIEMGVDGMISDYPEELVRFLKEKKLR